MVHDDWRGYLYIVMADHWFMMVYFWLMMVKRWLPDCIFCSKIAHDDQWWFVTLIKWWLMILHDGYWLLMMAQNDQHISSHKLWVHIVTGKTDQWLRYHHFWTLTGDGPNPGASSLFRGSLCDNSSHNQAEWPMWPCHQHVTNIEVVERWLRC